MSLYVGPTDANYLGPWQEHLLTWCFTCKRCQLVLGPVGRNIMKAQDLRMLCEEDWGPLMEQQFCACVHALDPVLDETERLRMMGHPEEEDEAEEEEEEKASEGETMTMGSLKEDEAEDEGGGRGGRSRGGEGGGGEEGDGRRTRRRIMSLSGSAGDGLCRLDQGRR